MSVLKNRYLRERKHEIISDIKFPRRIQAARIVRLYVRESSDSGHVVAYGFGVRADSLSPLSSQNVAFRIRNRSSHRVRNVVGQDYAEYKKQRLNHHGIAKALPQRSQAFE